MASCGFRRALDIFSDGCCSGEPLDHCDEDNDIFVIKNIPRPILESISNHEDSIDTPVTPPRIKLGHADNDEHIIHLRKGSESPTSAANTNIFDEEHTSLYQSGSQVDLTPAVVQPPAWPPQGDVASSKPQSLCVPTLIPSLQSSTTPTQSRKRRRPSAQNKLLRFFEKDKHETDVRSSIRWTLARSDMTDQERRNTWLQPEEFMFIQQRDQNLAVTIEENEDHSRAMSSFLCTRGLESRLQLPALRKQSHRLIGLEEILLELERQWDNFDQRLLEAEARGEDTNPETNPEAILFHYDFDAFAKVYADISRKCQIQAGKRALEDRREVEEYLYEKGDSQDKEQPKSIQPSIASWQSLSEDASFEVSSDQSHRMEAN